ncbi:MAG: hypothetical protein ACKOB4_06275, partial [Acidobacteriota bacterium]
MIKGRLFTLALLFAAALGGRVDGHAVPYSYLDLQVGPTNGEGRITAKLVVHAIDLADHLGVAETQLLEADRLATHRQSIIDLLNTRLLISLDRQAVSPLRLLLEPLPDRREIILNFEYDPASPVGL